MSTEEGEKKILRGAHRLRCNTNMFYVDLISEENKHNNNVATTCIKGI